jgi:hypothetical protein
MRSLRRSMVGLDAIAIVAGMASAGMAIPAISYVDPRAKRVKGVGERPEGAATEAQKMARPPKRGKGTRRQRRGK